MSHAILVGPHIGGEVTLSDGTVVDVSEDVIYVEDESIRDAVLRAIEVRYETEGHPLHDAENPFIADKD